MRHQRQLPQNSAFPFGDIERARSQLAMDFLMFGRGKADPDPGCFFIDDPHSKLVRGGGRTSEPRLPQEWSASSTGWHSTGHHRGDKVVSRAAGQPSTFEHRFWRGIAFGCIRSGLMKRVRPVGRKELYSGSGAGKHQVCYSNKGGIMLECLKNL